MFSKDNDRYSRQIRFGPIGAGGQQRFDQARVLVIGVGALGSASSEMLARAGVGFLRLVDRDFVDWSNLQRQSLYCERDVKEGLPKAIAAANRLREINSNITIDPVVADVLPTNIGELAQDMDLIVDGTDHFDIRFLINDISIVLGVPWVFGGCLGAEGQVMTIVPGETPCLRCWMPDGPPMQTDTCDSVGVIGPIVQLVASLQVAEVMKVLVDAREAICGGLQAFSLWDSRFRQISGANLRDGKNCLACDQKSFEWLYGEKFTSATKLCGRNSVQISPGIARQLDLGRLADTLKAAHSVTHNAYLLRVTVDTLRVTAFADGRAIIEGTEDVAQARTLYTRLFG